MGMGAPLLNDYKQDFVWKRIPQTLLGGPKFHIGYRAPFYVYINQFLLFIFPFILGGILTLIIELVPLRFDIGCYMYGSLMFVFVLLVQILSVCRTRIGASVAPKQEKHNILDEEDELEFEGCCGRETVSFVCTSKSIALIPVHALLCGGVSGLGLWFLLPSVLNELYASVASTAASMVFGWLTMCIGSYSLTVTSPPELSQYRALIGYDIVPARTLHMALCFLVNVVAMSVADSTGTLTLINQISHVVFCALPLFWMTGLLPGTEPFILWSVEQCHVHLLGGSHMANPVRTLVIFSLSALSLLIYLSHQSPQIVIIFLSVFGYFLSLDLCGLFSTLTNCALKRTPKNAESRIVTIVLKTLFYIIMLILICATASLTYIYNTDISAVRVYIGYGVIGLLCADTVLSHTQRVYWLGLFRNPLFPPDVLKTRRFSRRKKILFCIGILRRVIFNFVSPILLLMYVVSLFTSEYTSTITDFWHCITVARALRWIFQSTSASLVEVTVHVILSVSVSSATLSTWPPLLSSAGTQLLIISLSRDRIVDFFHKLQTTLVVLLDSWRDDKQRRGVCTLVILILNILLLPLTVCLILLPASVLAAPLLPWFTLPLFWIAAPRPRHFWAPPIRCGAEREKDVSGDAVLYLQDIPALTNLVHRSISYGALESSPGSQYLLRYQDRLVWISVLERGYSYTTVQIKGLELQETSCHTIEAARIDDLFKDTFELDSSCGINKYLMNTLTPRDAHFMGTYSDAKNILTGIIDSPENLNRVFDDYTKSLTYILLEYLLRTRKECIVETKSGKPSELIEVSNLPKIGGSKLPPLSHKTSEIELKPLEPLKPLKPLGPLKPLPSLRSEEKPPTPDVVKQSKLVSKEAADCDLEDLLDDWDSPPDSPIVTNKKSLAKFVLPMDETLKASKLDWDSDFDRKPPQKGNWNSDLMDHEEKGNWDLRVLEDKETKGNSDFDTNEEKKTEKSKMQWDSPPESPMARVNVRSGSRASPAFSEDSIWSTDSIVEAPKNDRNRLLPGLSNRMDDVAAHDYEAFSPPSGIFGNDRVSEAGVNLQNDIHNLTSLGKQCSPPSGWLNVPVDRDVLNTISKLALQPFVRTILKRFSDNENIDFNSLSDDFDFCRLLTQLIAVGRWVFYGTATSSDRIQIIGSKQKHLYQSYIGRIDNQAAEYWLDQNPELKHLLIKAFRFSVKLMIDQAVLGPLDDEQELMETLEEYHENWYIGQESEDEWIKHVKKGTLNLLSLSHSNYQNVYSSRTLSLINLPVYMGVLNDELVRAQWANLSVELLYMTNDDEERYSIQAHANILRNLTVQAADPPLGYPLYTSSLTSIHTL